MMSENFEIYRRDYTIAIMALVVIAATTAFSAWLMGPIVEEVFLKKDLTYAYYLSATVVVVFLIKGAMTYLQSVILNRIGNNVVARFQRRIYGHLLSLGVGFFSGQHSAYLVGRVNQNIMLVRDMLNTVILAGARDLLSLIGLIGVMLWSDLFMSLFVFTAGPIALFTVGRYARRVKNIARQEVDLNARVTTAIQETSAGIVIVKAFTMEEQLSQRLNALTEEAEQRANKIARIVARSSPLMETLAGFSVAGVIAYGGYRVVMQDYSAANLTAFMTACLMAYEPAKRLARLKVTLERSLVNARMLYEILDTPVAGYDSKGLKELALQGGEVRFANVDFQYSAVATLGRDIVDSQVDGGQGEEPAETPVLRNMSFVAEAGKTTALVGPSGGGKSTAFSLIQRFYEPDKGVIIIDGQDISEVSVQSLREQIAYVSQHPVLFQGTVRENLRFARPTATDQEIETAAVNAQAHDFIMALPEGYDTPLSENGSNLSGGQRQRMSIARALVRDAPILLLDEATSALDNESEAQVQEALKQLMKGRTTLVIAHRLSTIADSDSIVVVDAGRVVDQGKHDELLVNDQSVYARLHSISAR